MSEPRAEHDLITFLIGGFGAGKTELALNLAIHDAARQGPGRSHLLDLDIVNPFFRVRKVRADLEKAGVVLVTPDERVQNGDLPALPAGVWAAFERPDTSIICDVGGGEIGLRPLARLTDLAARRRVRVLCVVNPFRPGFQSTAQIGAAMKRFSEVSALTITHLVPNPHLGDESTIELFRAGYDKVRAVGDAAGLPIPFAVMGSVLAGALGKGLTPAFAEGPGAFHQLGEIPVFVIRRFWEKPWQIGLPAA